MRVLITGITGFVGSHLAEYYLNNTDDEVIGLLRHHRSPKNNINHIEDRIKLVEGDITDAHGIGEVIKDLQPHKIHHLASQSLVSASWKNPLQTFEINAMGSINLFEAVRKYCISSIVHITSTSEVYGTPTILPITENFVLKPLSPYGVSKAAMDLFAQQYTESYGMRIIITRAFNHTGARRPADFVASSIAKQIATIEKGLVESAGELYFIKLGNLQTRRNFTDVRDIVEAYYIATKAMDIEYGKPYNICTDGSTSIGELAEQLIDLSYKDKEHIKISVDESKFRPSDVKVLEGDSTQFREATGWSPRYTLRATLEDLLEYWREKV